MTSESAGMRGKLAKYSLGGWLPISHGHWVLGGSNYILWLLLGLLWVLLLYCQLETISMALCLGGVLFQWNGTGAPLVQETSPLVQETSPRTN